PPTTSTSTLFPYTTLFRSLIKLQRRQLRRDHVVVVARMANVILRGDRVLVGSVEAGIEKGALTLHLRVRDVRVPIRHIAPRARVDRKSTRLNSSHRTISYA